MSSLVRACKWLSVLAAVGACSGLASGQVQFQAEGGEYPVVGRLQGDQVFPHAAINPFGGYLVWHDNATDGDGYGISARRLNRTLTGSLGVFRVNESAAGDQMMPQVALLSGGGAVVTWQTVDGARTKVFARFINADGTFAGGDVPVSDAATEQQVAPVVAGLPDGNALIVWASSDRDGSMLGIFGQRFSPVGAKIGADFQINQTAQLNQRNPAVATLANGNVLVAWVSERARGTTQNEDQFGNSLDPTAGGELFDINAMGRIYSPAGEAAGGEFRLNSDATICANPSVSPSADGFLVAWGGKPNQIVTRSTLSDSWDIYARPFTNDGRPLRGDFKVNTFTTGDQYLPKVSSVNGLHLIAWTSVYQDGSREGVIARIFNSTADSGGAEFRVNTTTASQQIHPIVAANGARNFLVVWSSFTGLQTSFDLFGQQYSVSGELSPPSAPSVSALSQTRLSVAWPELSGLSSVKFELYVDQSPTPIEVDGTQWTIVGLASASTHAIRLAYRLSDGRRSPLSDAVTGRTWAEDENFDGLPDDWQTLYWGASSPNWGKPGADSDGDGATNLEEFLAGTNPTDPASVLRTTITTSSQGWRLEWNCEPGYVYQVQSADDAKLWTNIGSARFAAGKVDSIPISGEQDVALYRVIRLR